MRVLLWLNSGIIGAGMSDEKPMTAEEALDGLKETLEYWYDEPRIETGNRLLAVVRQELSALKEKIMELESGDR